TIDRRVDGRFTIMPPFHLLRARQDLLPHQGEARFDGARGRRLKTLQPTFIRQSRRRPQQPIEPRFEVSGCTKIPDPGFEPAAAPIAEGFRAADPAPQFRELDAGEMRGESAVGGIKDMMALIENDARDGIAAQALAIFALIARVAYEAAFQ